MLFRTRNESRPYHFGPYPIETLKRSPTVIEQEKNTPPKPLPPLPEPATELAEVARDYINHYGACRKGDVFPTQAPVPEDLQRRAMDIKGYGFFIDAAHVGICEIPASAWYEGAEDASERFAVAFVVEDGRLPEKTDLAYQWLKGAEKDISHMRATEIACCIAGHIRILGYQATVHCVFKSDVDLEKLGVLAGVVARRGETVVSPYLDNRFALAVVTTSYAMQTDEPLASAEPANRGLKYWFGINGAVSGRERRRMAGRPLYMSRYPMEQVKRVDRPTTLIIDDEVPRIPKRAEFFQRAKLGDVSKKAKQEQMNGVAKSTYNNSMFGLLMSLIPHQDGAVAPSIDNSCQDPKVNAKAIKSLAYHMGADLVGICEAPAYAWYSHDFDGKPLEVRHKYAICMLLDQGYETMEGASGDDWISSAQSMRAYLRGAEIAGVMGELIRGKGYSSKSHTVLDGDVLQIPLLLWAGLGELSRIGELVLNPYVGPRFKSVVLTTDIPMEVDKPIDFGLQYFCNHCTKCARECPCNAMPFGDKVMFNGYEMWKPDVERCVSYRLTNPKGSMCGRCMKMCPLNKVPSLDGPLVHRIGTWLGVNARWLKPLMVPIAVYLDDKLGYGMRNPVKRWWLDLEIIKGKVKIPPKGTNERDLDLDHVTAPEKQKIAYYPASTMPLPDNMEAHPLDRKEAMAMAELMETPEEARRRIAEGGAKPMIYTPRHLLKD